MFVFKSSSSPQVLNNHISVQVAASYSGYSLQYLRRLLRNSKLEGIKIGQLWLVEKGALDIYIEQAQDATDCTSSKEMGQKWAIKKQLTTIWQEIQRELDM